MRGCNLKHESLIIVVAITIDIDNDIGVGSTRFPSIPCWYSVRSALSVGKFLAHASADSDTIRTIVTPVPSIRSCCAGSCGVFARNIFTNAITIGVTTWIRNRRVGSRKVLTTIVISTPIAFRYRIRFGKYFCKEIIERHIRGLLFRICDLGGGWWWHQLARKPPDLHRSASKAIVSRKCAFPLIYFGRYGNDRRRG